VAAAQAQGGASPRSEAADASGEEDAAVTVLDSPEKRRKAPLPAAAAARHLADRSAAPAGPARKPSSSRGRGRRPAYAGAAPIIRYLQRHPAGGEAPPAGAAASAACRDVERDSSSAVEGTPRGGGLQQLSDSHDGVIDLSQSASPPQRGMLRSAAPAPHHPTAVRAAPRRAFNSSDCCSVEREIEELLASRGIVVQQRPVDRTPAAARPVGRALSFATPSTGGDIVVDLATPLSQESAER